MTREATTRAAIRAREAAAKLTREAAIEDLRSFAGWTKARSRQRRRAVQSSLDAWADEVGSDWRSGSGRQGSDRKAGAVGAQALALRGVGRQLRPSRLCTQRPTRR